MQDDIKTALTAFRDSIDNLDAALIYLVAERFRLTQKVGEFKRDHDLPPADPGREEKQIARLRQSRPAIPPRSRFRRAAPALHHR